MGEVDEEHTASNMCVSIFKIDWCLLTGIMISHSWKCPDWFDKLYNHSNSDYLKIPRIANMPYQL